MPSLQTGCKSMVSPKDTEVLMKNYFNSIFFLCSSHHRKTTSLCGPIAAKKTYYDRALTKSPRQLIYESTADDVFWVLHPKLQREERLKCLS